MISPFLLFVFSSGISLQVDASEKAVSGPLVTKEVKQNISLDTKHYWANLPIEGRVPWNKGVKAWNNGLTWTDEVKNNISQGMLAYWKTKKQQRQNTLLEIDA
jgi:hypothetical protein